MCDWRSELRPGYSCPYPALGGSSYCIFHSDDPNKDLAHFRAALAEHLHSFADNLDIDLTGFIFPSQFALETLVDVVRERCKSRGLLLTEAVIPGRLGLEGLMIGRCLRGENATIKGGLYLSSCKVRKDLCLRGIRVEGTAHLGNATVEGDLLLGGAFIEGDLYVAGACVEGELYLHGLELEGTLQLDASHLKGGFDCSSASIGSKFLARGIDVTGRFSLSETQVFGDFVISESELHGDVDLTNVCLGSSATFDSTMIRKKITLTGAQLLRESSFQVCRAAGVDLGENRPSISLFAKNRRGVSLDSKYDHCSLWRFARITYEQSGQRERADAAHYYERSGRMQRACSSSRSLQALGLRILRVLDFLFVRLTTAYGVSVPRTMGSWIAVILVFACIYTGCPHLLRASVLSSWTFRSFASSLYFSITTFTTLGLGDVYPATKAGAVVVAGEAVLGGFLMALTVVVLSRKYMR